MIKKNLKFVVLFTIGIQFLLTSCEGMGADSIYDLDTPGEIEAIKKEIIERVGDIPTFEIRLTSSEELTTSLDQVTLVTNDQATAATLHKKTFQFSSDIEPTTSVIDSDFSVRVYNKNEPQQLSAMDFELIETNFEAAKKLIPTEFIEHALYSYTVQFEYNKRADAFIINTIREDENNHLEGNNLVTNYYEFSFEMDENGTIIMLED